MGAGDRLFCIGGRKEGMEDTTLYAGMLPTLEIYESIEHLQKPVIASVNGYAVGGGQVLQVMCDLTIAKESAASVSCFRYGSFHQATARVPKTSSQKEGEGVVVTNPRLTARGARPASSQGRA